MSSKEFGIDHGNIKMDLVRFHADPTIQADERDNFGDPIAEFPPLFVLKDGWDSGQGTAMMVPASKDEQARAIAQRKARIAEWRELGDKGRSFVAFYNPDTVNPDKTVTKGKPVELSYAELARFAETVWSDAKGNIIAPTHLHNSCIRRGYAAMASALALFHAQQVKPDAFVIPYVERVYADTPEGQARRARDRWDENVQLGRQPYTDADLLVLVCKSINYFGSTEAEIMREFGMPRGKAQKLHKLAKVALAFPDLHITERCKVKPTWDAKAQQWERSKIKSGPAEGQEPILLSSILPAEVAYLLGESGKKGAAAPELAEASGAKDGVGATAEQLETYFNLLYRGRTNKPKALGEGELKNLVEGLLNPTTETERIVKQVLQAVRDGEKQPIVDMLRIAREQAQAIVDNETKGKGKHKVK